MSVRRRKLPGVMRLAATGTVLLLVLAACGYRIATTEAPDGSFYESKSAVIAQAGLRDAKDVPVGHASFRETRLGALLELRVTGLPAGTHGVHIHAAARCEPPAFTTAGPHFNPNASQHGMKNAQGPHAGDLPNLVVGSDGTGKLSFVNPYLSLQTGASHSLLLGTSIVIHAAADDEKTDPSGNSGDRIACGVITRGP